MASIRIGQIGVTALVAAPASIGAVTSAPITERYLHHNWVGASELECAYSTDITASKVTVSEERRGLLNKPSRTQRCQFSAMTRAEATAAVYALSRAAQTGGIFTPVYSSETRLTAAVAGTVVPCDTRWRRFHVGGKVLLYNPTSEITEVGVITSLTKAAITLTGAVSGTFNTTRCRVYPLMDSEVLLHASFSMLTDAHNDINVEFRERIGASSLPPLAQWAPAGAQIVRGYPVFRTDPDWAQSVEVSVEQQGSMSSLGRGSVTTTRGTRPKYGFSFGLTALSRKEAWNLIRHFDAMQGRLRVFWLINPHVLWDKDSAATVVIAASMTVPRHLVGDTGGETDIDEFTDFIAIEEWDGTLHIRGIASVTATTAGGLPAYEITFDTVLSGSIATTDIKRITSAHKVRFSSDALPESWITDEACTLKFSCIEVLEEVSATITNLTESAAASGFEEVGSAGGPFAWLVASKNAYAAGAIPALAIPGSPSGDGNEVYEVYDTREAAPGSGPPVGSLRPYWHNSDLTGTIKLHKPVDYFIGRGRLVLHFPAANTDSLTLQAISAVNIVETWFDNTLGVTMFIIVTDMQDATSFFLQTGVFEWSNTICKLFDALGVDNANHHVDYTDQTVRSNEVAIYLFRWDPGVETQVWKNGITLGTATTPIVDFPAGGGDITITGDDCKVFDFMLYKEALSLADVNTVGNLLATLFNTTWATVS